MSSSDDTSCPHNGRCFCAPYLIEALHEVVYRSPIRAKEIAAALTSEFNLPISVELLYAWATEPENRSQRHRCMPLRWLIPLSKASQNPYILDELERRMGRQIPAIQDTFDGPIESLALQISARMAEVLVLVTQALADGQLTPEDLNGMLPLLRILRTRIDVFETESKTLVVKCA